MVFRNGNMIPPNVPLHHRAECGGQHRGASVRPWGIGSSRPFLFKHPLSLDDPCAGAAGAISPGLGIAFFVIAITIFSSALAQPTSWFGRPDLASILLGIWES